MGSGEDGGDVGCVGGVEAVVHGGWFALKDGRERSSVGEGVGEEAFARSSDEDGKVEFAEVFEMREDGVIFVEAFPEAEAWIEHDFLFRNVRRGSCCEAFFKLCGDEWKDFVRR